VIEFDCKLVSSQGKSFKSDSDIQRIMCKIGKKSRLQISKSRIFLFTSIFYLNMTFIQYCMPEYLLHPQYQGSSLISRKWEYLHTEYIHIKTTLILISVLFMTLRIKTAIFRTPLCSPSCYRHAFYDTDDSDMSCIVPLTVEQTDNCMKQLKFGKAAGHDGLTAEQWAS